MLPPWLQDLIDSIRGIVPEEKQEEFDKITKNVEVPEEDPPSDPPADSEPGDVAGAVQQALAPVQQQLKALQSALKDEKKARQDAVDALESRQQEQRAEEITGLLDSAVKDGRIESEKRETWKARLETDFDGYKETLDEMSPPESVKKAGQSSGTETSTSSPTPTSSSVKSNFLNYAATGDASGGGD